MTPVVIGTPNDVLGFALAGAATFAVNGDAEVQRAIERAERTVEEPLIILLCDGRIEFVFPE